MVLAGGSVSIVVEDYQKSYGNFVAVADVSFRVERGQILGLAGPNGAGKTTTLRAIAGIIAPSHGRITVAGYDIATHPVQAKQRLAYVPDDPRLFDRLTVWEHWQFTAAAYGLREWKTLGEQLLERLELVEKRDSLTTDLSRGMKQKVAIGCAYLHQPEAILLDEPLTGLDPRGIRTMKDMIREYAKRGTTFIVSSHLLNLLEDLVDRVLILHRGEVLLHQSLPDLRQRLMSREPPETLEELFLRLTSEPRE